ncbi:MAG: lipoprotein insertase outer membrane protein LolB [Pseudomonadota bacterium]|nr:lipoprotein insertase outer membrane protein LolB [Pseudomonadota bacterium]
MKNLTASLLVLLLFSCAGSQTVQRPSPLAPECWLSQPVIYRLRQSAQLEYQGKKEMLEGFMELDLTQDLTHLVIFNALGLTLLNIEIERHRYQLAETDSESEDETPPNRRKQQFAAAVATAVQHIFFSLESNRKNYCRDNPPALAKFKGTPPRLTRISENRQKPTWTVTYHDYDNDPAHRLPGRIILQNRKPDYRLTIWLHKAEVI